MVCYSIRETSSIGSVDIETPVGNVTFNITYGHGPSPNRSVLHTIDTLGAQPVNTAPYQTLPEKSAEVEKQVAASVVNPSSVKTLPVFATAKDWPIKQYDIMTAFLSEPRDTSLSSPRSLRPGSDDNACVGLRRPSQDSTTVPRYSRRTSTTPLEYSLSLKHLECPNAASVLTAPLGISPFRTLGIHLRAPNTRKRAADNNS